MALRQTKKISELPALSPASLDTTFVVGISGSTTYKISINNLTSSLDTTFATDLVTSALSNTLDTKLSTSSFNSYTASAINGTISGSSQLTSSFDQRYVISGSITQTTWDNIANKPSGIVSQSTDLSSLNSKTGSYATTGSNLFNGDQSISGSIIPAVSGAYDLGSVINPWRHIYVNTGSIFLVKDAQIVKVLNANTIVTTTDISSGSVNISPALPVGVVSGSQQISDLGFVTGSYTTINSFNSLTQSFNSISQSFNVISGSVVSIQGGFDTGSYQTFTSSVNTSISNLNTFTASVTTASIVTSISNLNTFTASISTASLVTSISNLNTFTASQSTSSLVDRLNAIESVSGSWITESETGSFLTSLSGAISSSSQLTSSYDTRYTLSGSVQPLPSNLLSSSAQITAFGFISSSAAIPAGTISGSAQITTLGFISSSQTINTSSFATTGSNTFNGNQQITGSLLISQNITGSASASFVSLAVNTTTPTQKIHLKGAVGVENGTTGGNTADQFVFGYVGSNLTQYTHKIQTGHDAQAALNRMDFLIANSSTTWKTPLQLRPDVINVSGSLIVTGSINGTIAATNGVVSGSSQILGGSGIFSSSAQLPTGTTSGSSQLTSSYDGRYIQTGSFNTYTSSFSSSLASSITSVSGTFTNLTVNGQPTTYGVVSPAYLVTGLVSSVNTLGLNQTIILDTILGNVNSQVSYNNSTGIYTLVAGVTYDMSFTPSFISFSNTTGGFLIYQWVDATTNTPLDSTSIGVGTAVPYTDTGAQNDNVTARVIYTPNTNQTVKLYITSANGTANLRGAIGTQAVIKPLNLSVAIQATATGTLNTDYISVGNNGSPQNVAASGTDIIFDTNIASSGIGYNTSTGVFTLTAGKTYRITSEIGFAEYNKNGYVLVQLVDATTNTAINTQVNSYPYNTGFNEVNNLVSDIIYTPNTNQTVKFRVVSGSSGLTAQQRGGGFSRAVIQQIANTFALNTLATMQISGSLTTTGSITSLGGITGSIAATNGVISGSSQLTTAFPSKTTGAWSVPAGASTQSFSVEAGASYTMWVNGNIPNGIITWNATVTTSNTNVPVVGSQYGWYYTAGNALVLTAMPDQIIGTNGSIANIPTSYAPNTSNVFKFGITNNSGTTQTINYGYIKLS